MAKVRRDRVKLDQVTTDRIRNHRFDLRGVDELAGQIKAAGRLIQPIALRVRREGGSNVYDLVAGHRRVAALRVLQDRDPSFYSETFPDGVPCIRHDDLSDGDAAAVSLSENIDRESASPAEIAIAVMRMADDHGMTSDEIGAKHDRTGAWARMYAQIGRDLGEEALAALHTGRITVNQAKLLARVAREDQGEHLATIFEERDPPTRLQALPLEDPPGDGGDPPAKRKAKKPKKVQNSKATEKLRDAAGTKPKRPGVKEFKARINALDGLLDLSLHDEFSPADVRDLLAKALTYACGEGTWESVLEDARLDGK